VSLTQTIEPVELPVDLDDVKAHLKITDNDEDSLILGYLKAATDFAQEYTWSQFCTSTFVERFDRFPCMLVPMKNPLQAGSVTLQYVDTGGTTQTLVENTDYVVDPYSKPARIYPAYAKWWPTTRGYANDVILTYTAGYASVEAIPDEIKQAVMMKTAMLWASRGGCEISEAASKAISCLLDLRSYRVFY
jgi:uncharacterized phiE125 gp8 family phage protein